MELNPQHRWAVVLGLFVKGMPRPRYTRLILSDLLMGNEPGTLHSSNDLSEEQASELFDYHFPEWRDGLVDIDNHPEIFELAKQANQFVDAVYPHPPQSMLDPEERAQRQRAKHEAYKERRRAKRQVQYEQREAKRQAKKTIQQETKHLEVQTYQSQMDKDRLSRLNEWRAKAGLPPVKEL